jgi:hypothetical protein
MNCCFVLIKPSSTTILKYQIETKQLSSTIDQQHMLDGLNMFFSYVVIITTINNQLCILHEKHYYTIIVGTLS